jgi:hypothetical protein
MFLIFKSNGYISIITLSFHLRRLGDFGWNKELWVVNFSAVRWRGTQKPKIPHGLSLHLMGLLQLVHHRALLDLKELRARMSLCGHQLGKRNLIVIFRQERVLVLFFVNVLDGLSVGVFLSHGLSGVVVLVLDHFVSYIQYCCNLLLLVHDVVSHLVILVPHLSLVKLDVLPGGKSLLLESLLVALQLHVLLVVISSLLIKSLELLIIHLLFKLRLLLSILNLLMDVPGVVT